MKKMYKKLSLLLALTMLAGVLSACGAKQEPAADPAPETDGPVAVEKLNIAFAPYDASEVIMAATELTRTHNFAMFSLVCIVPGVSLLLCSIPMFFYKIAGKEKADMLSALEEKRKNSGIVIE